ncbi:molybdopterin-dependent oxidoreductase [Actinospica sp. MGRD01-02]|uniref:Molybdopterin-dependent oxidoreductase n=1 Tax=Actinospica acidithermotolerans TaxID=2828514 RepID=A0A941E622_9ACTN|nr:molybdopterin-dependent oxidoreductase [Actinospica acidithermotolerans]MBR7825751.1 molybdopterin-dependent oxidoreductase [Actinospica acidithermotolerans]
MAFPTPPKWLRRGPLRAGAFRPDLHDERTASLIGTALGIAFVICFVTGLISHELQQQRPPTWLPLPTHPVWFYRFTQGLHVATGLACVPLLLAKLWTVYPRLFAWPPVTSILHALERLSILVLVAGAIFELVTGIQNIAQWYPWHFPFVPAHHWVAWITVGALLLHLAVKAPAIARGLRNRPAPGAVDGGEGGQATAGPDAAVAAGADLEPAAATAQPGGVSRRVLIGSTALAVLAVTATTIGQSVTSLRFLDLLGVRSPHDGPQGVPINRTASQAGVLQRAVDPGWALEVDGPRPYRLTLAELNALPQYRERLPIACVEGWSVDADWEGVRLRDLLARAGFPEGSWVRVISLEKGGYGSSVMQREYASDPATLLALRLNGEVLSIDHGYPARIIAPARPGVLQTKWVTRLELIPA